MIRKSFHMGMCCGLHISQLLQGLGPCRGSRRKGRRRSLVVVGLVAFLLHRCRYGDPGGMDVVTGCPVGRGVFHGLSAGELRARRRLGWQSAAALFYLLHLRSCAVSASGCRQSAASNGGMSLHQGGHLGWMPRQVGVGLLMGAYFTITIGIVLFRLSYACGIFLSHFFGTLGERIRPLKLNYIPLDGKGLVPPFYFGIMYWSLLQYGAADELAHLWHLGILEPISLLARSLPAHISRRRLDMYSSHGRPRKVCRPLLRVEVSCVSQ